MEWLVENWRPLAYAAGWLAAAILLSLIVHRLVFRFLRGMKARTRETSGRLHRPAFLPPCEVHLPLVAVYLVLRQPAARTRLAMEPSAPRVAAGDHRVGRVALHQHVERPGGRAHRALPHRRRRQPERPPGPHPVLRVAPDRGHSHRHAGVRRHADDVSVRSGTSAPACSLPRDSPAWWLAWLPGPPIANLLAGPADGVDRAYPAGRRGDRRRRVGAHRGDQYDLRCDPHLGSAAAGGAALLFHREAVPELDAHLRPTCWGPCSSTPITGCRWTRCGRSCGASSKASEEMGREGLRSAGDQRYRAHHGAAGADERRRFRQGLGPALSTCAKS